MDKILIIDGKKYVISRFDVDMGSLFKVIKKVRRFADNILIVSTVLGEHRFIGSGDEDFIGLIMRAVDDLGGEYRMSKGIIFGGLRIPADNLLIRVKKLLNLS